MRGSLSRSAELPGLCTLGSSVVSVVFLGHRLWISPRVVKHQAVSLALALLVCPPAVDDGWS